MNAHQARELAVQNSPRAAAQKLESALVFIRSEIKKTAEEGNFKCLISCPEQYLSIQAKLELEGYIVAVFQERMSISWK